MSGRPLAGGALTTNRIRASASANYRRLLVLGCCLLASSSLRAQQPYVESEPNDTPERAAAFRGPAQLMGAMPGGDQDAWLWRVSDEDAGRHWSIELQGLPGRLTIADIGRVRYDAAGALAGFDRLLKIGSRDGAQPTVFDGLLFEPGEYLVGTARSGGSATFRPATDSLAFGGSDADQDEPGATTSTDAYRLIFQPGAAVPASSDRQATTQDAAVALDVGAAVAAVLEDDAALWYRLDIPEHKAASRWDIDVRVPVGRTAEASFRDAAGSRLASARTDSEGRLTLRDISRPAGAWFIDVRPILTSGEAAGFVHLINVSEVGQRVAGEEAEPNDRWEFANRADSPQCCSGRINERGDDDRFAYTLEESGNLRALVVDTATDQPITACLLDDRGSNIQCRDGSGTIRMPDLLLPAGEYGVYVTGKAAGTEYSIAFHDEGPPQPGREVEPNDAVARAIGTPENNRIRGSFDSGDDVDYYRFTLAGDPQLWRVQAIGDAVRRLTYHDVTGTQQQSIDAGRSQRRLQLDNLFLFPGTHVFSIAGRDSGDYTLLARPLGPPDPDSELEPNDDAGRRMPLRIGQTRTGLLSDPGDVDQYRFHLAGWDHIRLTATPPADGSLVAKLYFNSDQLGTAARTEGPIEIAGVFPPGDYQLELAPREPSEAEYTVSLERLDRFRCASDCEPNNNPVLAQALPAGGVVHGVVGDWDDGDWFRLPVVAADQAVTFTVESETRVSVRLYDHRVNRLDLAEDRATSTYTATLPAGQASLLHIESARTSPYTLTLPAAGDAEPATATAPLDATATLAFSVDRVAAYARVGQRIDGRLEITNQGSEPLQLAIDSAVSDMAWTVAVDGETVTLAPGATQSIGVTAMAPVDARADKPVRIGMRAKLGDQRFISAFADIAVDADAEPVGPVRSWDIPPSLKGGLDVAHRRFGASLSAVPEPRGDAPRQLAALIDGRSARGDGASFDLRRDRPLELTIDLAGSEPVPVAGFALNPLGRISVNFAPAEVELQLSSDGNTFRTVATGRVLPVGTDQYITLDTPVPATHARLLLEGAWTGEIGRRLSLGEIKVIATPGYAPVGVGDLNIADPDNGGHVVWSNPSIGALWDRGILTDADDASYYAVPAQQSPQWVLGFHHNRAAEIQRISWRDTDDANTKLADLTVSGSLESPVGPWQTIAEWNRTELGDELVLASPIRARFLRFSAPAAAEDRRVDPPERLAVYERRTGDAYRSVISEWGFRSQTGWYESTQPLTATAVDGEGGSRARDRAQALEAGVVAAGSVRLGQVSHWYRPALPDGHNALRLELTGDPTVRTEPSLTDTTGEPISLTRLPYESTPQRHVYEAYIDGGRMPLLEVREPPRNVLFLWDTSGSVDEFRPLIVNSMTTYAEDLVPGRDVANLQPFGSGGPILDRWSGEPYLMQLVLNDYRSFSDNSAAENNLRLAANHLADRPGTKAIVLISDAETPREPRVWEALQRVQPRVFTLNVGEQEQSQDLMQDWASVNDGHYAFIDQAGDMEIAFERVSAMLRRPAAYSLSMTTAKRDAPGPGYLRVVSGDAGPARGAVELILDASGSMLQRMEGRRRIDIAKEVLITAIQAQIPAGTPTAVRVFGHRVANACETDLEIPLGPLDAAAAAATISSIQAKNLARTPIAESLAAVSRDLEEASGTALIVLVTDGEETCDGDPAAVIADLRESGMDVSLNIVGFAIDDQALADQFTAWSKAGGGRYLSARDTETLADSVTEALATRFTVFDSSGDPVAEGHVGGAPVALPQGNYRVVVDTRPAGVSSVTISAATTTEIEAPY